MRLKIGDTFPLTLFVLCTSLESSARGGQALFYCRAIAICAFQTGPLHYLAVKAIADFSCPLSIASIHCLVPSGQTMFGGGILPLLTFGFRKCILFLCNAILNSANFKDFFVIAILCIHFGTS